MLYPYTVYAEVNNNKVMCHLSMKLFNMFDQPPPLKYSRQNSCKTYSIKNDFDLEPKGQGHSKKDYNIGNKNMPHLKN